MQADEDTKAMVLHKMMKHRLWGGKHTELRNLKKGFDPRIYKEVDRAISTLTKERFIITAIKTKEIHVSLNPRKYNEIIELVEKYFNIKILVPRKP